MARKKTYWWPLQFWWGTSFNGPCEWNFRTDAGERGIIINYVRGIFGISFGSRFIGILSTEVGPRPYTVIYPAEGGEI